MSPQIPPPFDSAGLLQMYKAAMALEGDRRSEAVSKAEKTIEAAIEAHTAQLRYAMSVLEPNA